jgi:hypothetical protein
MVLVVLLGYQTSGGPSVEIESIEEIFNSISNVSKGIRVNVKENREPGSITVITNPYHIVKVKKYGSVVFEREPSTKICMSNSHCEQDEFCLFKSGTCSGPGECILREEEGRACIQILVCGCDQRIYPNPCEAYKNGVSISKTGTCQ